MSLQENEELPKRKKAAAKPKADRHRPGPIAGPNVSVGEFTEPAAPACTADDVREFISSTDDATVSDLQAYIALEVTGRREKIRAELEAKAAAVGATVKWPGKGKAGSGSVPVKYRGPNGETWAGRGMMPNWLKSRVAAGHHIEDYAV